MEGRKADKTTAAETLASGGYDYDRMEGYRQMLEKRAEYETKTEEWKEYAREHPVISSADTVAVSPMQGVEFLRTMGGTIGHSDRDKPESYVPANYYDMDATNFAETVRGTIGEELAKKYDTELLGQNIASFLYDTGMSVADSTARLAVLGPAGSLWAGGGSAAASQAKNVMERGGTNAQAFWGGMAAGAAEMLFEKVSLENLLSEKTVTGWKSWLKETAKQAGVEASEEMFTEMANILSDAAMMGDSSDFSQAVADYVAQGMTKSRAEQQAFLDCIGQVAWAGAGGAVSGGAMGGTVNAANGFSNYAAKQNGTALRDMGGDEILTPAQAETLGKGSEAYQQAQKVQERLSQGKEISQRALGKLYEMVSREANERKNAVAKGDGKGYTEADPNIRERDFAAHVDTPDTEDLPFRFGEENAKEGVKTAEKGETKVAATQGNDLAREELQQAAERSLGESGRKAILGAYEAEAGQDTAEYYAGFSAYYQAAVDGKAAETVQGDYAKGLNPAQRMAAYTAGQNDREATLRREGKAAGYATASGTETGLVYDGFVQEAVNSGRSILDEEGNQRIYLTAQDAQRINTVAKALRVRVRFTDEVAGGAANAQISGNDILVEKNNPNPIMFLVGHEMTHRMQELAPKEYRAFREKLAAEDGSWSEKVNAVGTLYAARGHAISYDRAADEVAADKAGQLLESGELMDDFIRKHRDDRTMLEKIRDAIRSLIAKLTGAEKRKAQTAEGKLTAALEAASKQANKNAAREGGEAKYSAKASRGRSVELETMENNRFQRLRQFHENLPGEWYAFTGDYFYLYSNQSYTDYTILAKTKINQENRADIEWFIKEVQNGTFTGTEAFDRWTSSFQRGKGRDYWYRIDSSKPGTTGRHDGVDVRERGGKHGGSAEKSGGAGEVKFSLKDVTKDEGAALWQYKGGGSYDLNAKLTGAEKRKARTAEGKLTAALEAASKQANKNAAREGGEAKFSIKYDRKNTPYVLIEEDILDGVPRTLWVKTVKETLRKKFPEGVTVGNSVVRVDKQSVQEMTFSRYTQRLMRTEPALYADKLRATNNADEILRASRNYVNEALAHPRKDSIQEFARGDVLLQIGTRGYSGQVIVAMRANQTLLLYDLLNLKPAVIDKKIGRSKVNTANSQSETGSQATSDTDSVLDGEENVKTKFSLKTDSQGRELSDGQREFFKDSKVVDEEGRLLVVYHGTDDRFTVFDTAESRVNEGSFFFAQNREDAAAYSSTGRVLPFYVNLRNPIDYNAMPSEIYKLKTKKEQVAALKRMGYDGWMADMETGWGEVSAFYPEQIKRVTNLNPTDNADIRFSLKDVTKDEGAALWQYKGGGSYDLNAKLRDGRRLTEAERKLVADLDTGLKKLPVHEGTVYRRLSFDLEGREALEGFLTEHRVGSIVPYQAYTSSSTDIDGYPINGELTVLQIIDGKTGRDMADVGNNNESEILFPRNTRFVVERVMEDKQGKPVICMKEETKHGTGQLYPEERVQAVQQVQKKSEIHIDLHEVPGVDTRRGSDGRGMPGVRGEGTEDGRNSLKGTTISRNYEALVEENRLLREQVAGYAELKKKTLDLTKDRDYWKSQTRLTNGFATDYKAVEKAARSLVKEYGATVDPGDIQKPLQKLYDYLARGYDETGPVDSGEAWKRAENVARVLVENAVEADEGYYEQYAELRKYLRETKLVLSKEYQGDFPDFNAFRKSHMGKLRIGTQGTTNIDQVYQELSYLYPEFFDEQRQTTPQDQLQRIAEVAEGIYRVVEYNPFAEYMNEAITGAANEILDLFFDLPQTKKTFADRKQAEYIQRTGRIVENMREKNRKRVRQVMDQERQRRIEGIKKVKEKFNALDRMSRQRRQQTETRGKLNRMVDKLSRKLLRPTDTLHIPEDMRGAVANLLQSINRESGFQMEYGKDGLYHRVKPGSALGAELTKRSQAFYELKAKYADIVKNADKNGMQLVIDPQVLGDEATPGLFDEVIGMGDIPLADMNAEQLVKVYKVVKAVDWSINRAGQLLTRGKYSKTEEWANALREDCGARKGKRRGLGLSKSLETPYTYFSHFGEAGKAIYRMLRDAQDQETVMNRQVARTVEKLVDGETVKKLERETHEFELESGKTLTLTKAHIMDLFLLARRKQAQGHLMEGGVVQPEIPAGRNRTTHQKGKNGFWQTEEKTERTDKIEAGNVGLPLTVGDIQRITDTLTEEQRKLAADLQRVTAGLLADMGNEASMTAYGYKKFTEKDYWPLKVADIGVRKEAEKSNNNVRAIQNMGMAQPLTPGASNPIRLSGAFRTFANHASDMVTYAAWLCPMEDVNRLYNYRFWEDGAPTTQLVAPMLEEAGGTGAGEYWQKLMKDIQNGIRNYEFEPMTNQASKRIGGFKAATAGGNIRVIVQQPTAFFRAAAVLEPKDLARAGKAPTEGNGWEKAKKYAPIATRKDMGGFDLSNPKSMYETLFDGRGWGRKAGDVLSAGAGWADAVTWGGLWNACEWAVKREHGRLTPGGQEFYTETAKLFTEMIDQTQVVDGVLQRSNIMRGKGDLAQQSTAFMGEPIMSLNLMLRSWQNWRAETDPEKRGKARKRLARAGAALMVTNAVNALAQSMVDAIRDDDRDKDYWERWWAAFTGLDGDEETYAEKAWHFISEGNLGSNMNLVGQIPYVKDVQSLIQGYDVSRADTEIIADMVRATQTFVNSADGKGAKTRAYGIKELIAAGAKFFGLPVANVTRDLWGIARSAVNEIDSVPLMYAMEKAVYNISNSSNTRRYYAIMYRALEKGDYESYDKIRRDLMEESSAKENGVAAVNGATIESAMRSRYATAKEKDPSYKLERKALERIGYLEKRAEKKEPEEKFGVKNLDPAAYESYVAQRNETYSDGLEQLEGTKIYTRLGDKDKDDVVQALYDLATEMALEDAAEGDYAIDTKWMTFADEAQRLGIDVWEYALFHVAYQSAKTTRDTEGKTVKGESKGDHVRSWLEDNHSLTEEQREFLWSTVYQSEW